MKYKGTIYKYTSPSGKVYIGQTINEHNRHSMFLNVRRLYAGEVVGEFVSAKAAGEFFGKPRANSEISKVCKSYTSPSGRHYNTALGYRWEYKNIESSTTIENTSIIDGSE